MSVINWECETSLLQQELTNQEKWDQIWLVNRNDLLTIDKIVLTVIVCLLLYHLGFKSVWFVDIRITDQAFNLFEYNIAHRHSISMNAVNDLPPSILVVPYIDIDGHRVHYVR